MVADNPKRPGSPERPDIAAGISSFHIELAAGRHGAASHVLFYMCGTLDDGMEGIIIARVLHDRMEPIRHVIEAL